MGQYDKLKIMNFFLYFIQLSRSRQTSPFYKVLIGPNNTLNHDLNNETYFLYSSLNAVYQVDNKEMYYMKQGQFMEIDNSKAKFASTENLSLFVWRIPKDFCQESHSVSADHSAKLSVSTTLTENTTCIFFQEESIISFLNIEFSSSINTCKMEIFTDNGVAANKTDYVVKGKLSKSITKPFFIRFNNCSSAKVSSTIDLTVTRSSLNVFDCASYFVPKISSDAWKDKIIDVSECQTAADELIIYLKYTLIIVIIICIIIAYIILKPRPESPTRIAALE